MTGDVARWLQDRAGTTADPGRVHRISLQRNRDRAEVTALIRAADQSISALVLQLHVERGRWRIATIEHLERGDHHTHPAPIDDRSRFWRLHPTVRRAIAEDVTRAPVQPAARSVPSTFDLMILHGAAAADRHRASITDDVRRRAAYRTRADYWLRQADDIGRTMRLGQDHIDPTVPYITALLGPRPPEGTARTLWDQAAATIETYRRTWHITESMQPFGPPPSAREPVNGQQLHRRRTIGHVKALLREMQDTLVGNRGDHGIELSS